MWLAVKCCSQIPLLCAVLPMSLEVSHWLIAVRNENHPKRLSWKASPLPVSSHSLLLRHIRWLLPARAPTTAAAVAALQAGTSSVKPTSTSEGWPPPPPTMTWSSSVSREYSNALPLVIFCYRSAVDLFLFFLSWWAVETGWGLYWPGELEGNRRNVQFNLIKLKAGCGWACVFFQRNERKTKTFPDIMWMFTRGEDEREEQKDSCAHSDRCGHVVHHARRLMTDAITGFHAAPCEALPFTYFGFSDLSGRQPTECTTTSKLPLPQCIYSENACKSKTMFTSFHWN